MWGFAQGLPRSKSVEPYESWPNVIWIYMNAFVFFAIFHSSDSYESPFLDQNFAKNQERKGETSPSTSINFPLSEVWRYQVAGVKTHFLISHDSWPQTWGTLAATMVGGLVSSTLLKPMSTSAIVPVSCHKNYVTKYIYRCFFSNICIWPYLPWPIYFLSKKTMSSTYRWNPRCESLGPESEPSLHWLRGTVSRTSLTVLSPACAWGVAHRCDNRGFPRKDRWFRNQGTEPTVWYWEYHHGTWFLTSTRWDVWYLPKISKLKLHWKSSLMEVCTAKEIPNCLSYWSVSFCDGSQDSRNSSNKIAHIQSGFSHFKMENRSNDMHTPTVLNFSR